MTKRTKDRGLAGVHQAFDEARFGRDRILNLRALQPTGVQAAVHAEAWLRERQMAQAGEVLVITGRGNSSVDGVSVVRQAIIRLLPSLRRRNVIAGYEEHTAGSFLVRLAPVTALLEAPRRKKETAPPRPDPTSLGGLEPTTRDSLRELARHALALLGVQSPTKRFIEDEMLRQFTALSANIPDGEDREAGLQQAIVRALEEFGV